MPTFKPHQTLTLIDKEDVHKLKYIGKFTNINTNNKVIKHLCDKELKRIQDLKNT